MLRTKNVVYLFLTLSFLVALILSPIFLGDYSNAQIAKPNNIPAGCLGVTFERNLRVGAIGQDVKCLQLILNLSPVTQLSASGPGAPGKETNLFGAKTLVALRKWQALQGWTPANQAGSLTIATLNSWITKPASSNPSQSAPAPVSTNTNTTHR